jgi:hypothetical protein
VGSRKVDVVIARAVHLALLPGFDTATAARELITVADGHRTVLLAALLRIDRALNERWSPTAAAAGDAVRAALELTESREVVAA